MIRAVFAALVALCMGCSHAGPEDLMLDSGPIFREADGVYKGIPYAAPPVGALRWRPPAPVAPWTAPRRFDAFGPVCPQHMAEGTVSEDCLNLNVWTPDQKPGARLPVMVFIHGGGFSAGAGSLELCNGAELAREGVVVVTFNYRLGTLGFMAHPLLSAESPDGVSGNYGLLDQIAALNWVKRNIAAFGGDPGQVTVFGQSAGAESMALLLVSPMAQGLFHRAILHSPLLPGSLRPLREAKLGVVSAEAVGQRISAALGLDVAPDPLTALRQAAPADLNQAAWSLSGKLGVDLLGLVTCPTVDGKFLPDHPVTLLRDGRFQRLPLIVGTNANEGSFFLPMFGDKAAEPGPLKALFEKRFGQNADLALGLVRQEKGNDGWEQLEGMISARWFVSFARFLTRTAAGYGVPVYSYLYTRPLPDAAVDILLKKSGAPDMPRTRIGVPHGADIYPLFGQTGWYAGFSGQDRWQALAMRRYWTNFAKTGEPGAPGLQGEPVWPRFDPAAPKVLEFGRNTRRTSLPDDALLRLIEKTWLVSTY